MELKIPSETENSASLLRSTLIHVKSAELVTIKERTRGKKIQYVFVFNLEWSDNSSSTIWRSYSDLFELQCKLLDEFPEEASSSGKGKSRNIPYLPGRKIFKKSDLTLAEARRSRIAKYVKGILQLPQNISQSCCVVSFFHKLQDDPECFTQFPSQLNTLSDFESLGNKHEEQALITAEGQCTEEYKSDQASCHGNSFAESHTNQSYVSSLSTDNQLSSN